ncbi:MAG: hypothetical protein B655_1917, partial [Methanobacterium sp. Maddingley MBC34]
MSYILSYRGGIMDSMKFGIEFVPNEPIDKI